MNASQFLDDQKKLKVSFPKNVKPLTENLTLNFQLITFLTQDIIPTIENLQDKKVIQKNPVYNHLKKMSDEDSNYMHGVYVSSNKGLYYIKDYDDITIFFKNLASKLLSDYQKQSDRYLLDLLYVIIGYEFIISNAPFVALGVQQKPNYKGLNIIKNEHKSMIKIFNNRYDKISNHPFKHGYYKNLFEKMKHFYHKDFIELINKF